MWQSIKRILGGLWRGLTAVSKGITVLLPIVVLVYFIAVVVIGLQAAQPNPIPERGALLLNPIGVLVETRTPLEPIDALLQGDSGEVLLSDLVDAIRLAAEDDRIVALVMDLEGLVGPTVTQALEIAQAIDTFKATGKPVVAVGDYYDQGHYLVASQANSIIMHPEGGINLYGFGVYKSYVRQLLENVMVTMNVFRVGDNKSAVEPFLRDDMSESERRVIGEWLGELWHTYTTEIERGRGFEDGVIQAFVDQFPEKLEAAGGDQPQLLLNERLIDALMTHDQQASHLIELIGATNEEGDYQSMEFQSYLVSTRAAQEPGSNEAVAEGAPNVIAIVPVEGELIPGESGAGFAGSDTVVAQLAQALDADDVAAVVLRINSPGGSVFASELIREQVLALKAAGVPVVVSMGAVAASGGYYIAADADEIWAHSATITGSIGVFAAFPTVEKLYAWAGINVDGVASTRLTPAVRFDTGVNADGQRIIQSLINNVYTDFVGLVASGRTMSWEDVDAVAGGIVWSGRAAQEVGLVDSLGGLKEAVAAAAARSKLQDYEIRRIGTPLSPEQLILEQIGKELGTVALPGASSLRVFAAQLTQPLRVIDSLRDPQHLYVRCLECAGGL